jgi:hypothetical protein
LRDRTKYYKELAMKQKIFWSGMTAFFIIISSVNIFSEETISPEKSEEIINKIITDGIAYNKKYRGIEYQRTETIKEYDPSDDKLLSTSNLVISRREYIYEKPEYTVIKYEKDGKEMKPSDYSEKPGLPAYPVFDENGKDRYNVSIIGYETIEGTKCYKIKATPKEKTERHIDAYFYFSAKDLSPVMIDLTVGKLPFPLKEFSMKVFMSSKDGYFFTREFSMSMHIKIPLIINKKIICTGKTTETKLIMP